MNSVRRHHRPSHSFVLHYPHSGADALYGLLAVPAILLILLFVLLHFGNAQFAPHAFTETRASLGGLALAASFTLSRLLIAYALAAVCAVPLAILATHSALAQKALLPVFDILQSIPILAFFPVLVGFFLGLGLSEGAAIFMLFLTMVWTIVFALVGGVGLIPHDIMDAAEVFGVRGLAYIRRILLPALVPQLIVGSILALAQGWNIIIVVEVVRTYLPAGSSAPNLFGLGSLLVEAGTSGDTALFVAALGSTILIIALINILLWQKLLAYAQRFKFE